MKRKKAIKNKKEALLDINMLIMAKEIELAFLSIQKWVISSQPIPSKKFKKGGRIFHHHKDMNGPKIYGVMETETWKDTHKLRHNVVPNYEYRLQSKWVNDVGDVEWRDIPKKQEIIIERNFPKHMEEYGDNLINIKRTNYGLNIKLKEPLKDGESTQIHINT